MTATNRVTVYLWNADGTGHDAVATGMDSLLLPTYGMYTHRSIISVYSFKGVETFFADGKLIAVRSIRWFRENDRTQSVRDGMRVSDAGWGNRNRYILNSLGTFSLKTGTRAEVEAEALRLMSDMLMQEALNKLTRE